MPDIFNQIIEDKDKTKQRPRKKPSCRFTVETQGHQKLLHLRIKLKLTTCTPSCVSCMNSNNLLTTVLRNRQCARKNLGYWPTMYMMLEAIIALLSFPFFCSQSPSRSYIRKKVKLSDLSSTYLRYFYSNNLQVMTS